MFKNAIVRLPSRNLFKGITSVDLGIPDYFKAMDQHEAYVAALKETGVEVRILQSLESYPDAVFIEDICLCTPHCAIITRPGALSRQGEVAGFDHVISDYYTNIHCIKAPATLEAGDVMMVGNHFYIGISERTTLDGAQQLISILNEYGMTGSTVHLRDVLHLKTGMSYLEKNCLLLAATSKNNSIWDSFDTILVDKNESYAANSVWVNNFVLTPKGFPGVLENLRSNQYFPLELDVREFQKLDGGLSCLSLRF